MGEDQMRGMPGMFGGLAVQGLQMRNPPQMVSNESTLYVGNLSPRVDEQTLFNAFKDFKPVTCRIMRDTFTSESRRFAFVGFQTPDQAEKAKQALGFKVIDNFEMRLCFKRSQSDFKANANTFIKNLSSNTTAKQLEGLASEFGKILSTFVRSDDNGRTLGYGYVQFEDEAAANKAIEKLNGTKLNGQVLSVVHFVSSKNRPSNKTNVYIKQFPQSWDKAKVEETLKTLFSKHGEITSMGVYPHKNPATNTPSFYAFVAYKEEAAAAEAIKQYNGKDLETLEAGQSGELADPSKGLYVCFVISKGMRKAKMKRAGGGEPNITNLYIKSLKPTVTEDDLRRVFGKWGEVTSVCVREAKQAAGLAPFQGMPPVVQPPFAGLKFGFINFLRHEDAEKALFEGKKNPDVLALIHTDGHSKLKDFLLFHQPKHVRIAYLNMKKKMQPNFPMSGRAQPFPTFQLGPQFNVPLPAQNTTPGTVSRQSEREQPHTVEWLKKNQKEFIEMSKEKQNQILGNLMYNRVLESKLASAEQIPKVTGMLIDLEILEYAEVIDILENDAALKERITEALEILVEPSN